MMGIRSTFLPLLISCLVTFHQTPEENAVHIKAWTERHAQYMSEPRIDETEAFLEITDNAPRPLDDILATLEHQHGWHINYEDPLYGKSDIVDQTAPSWLGCIRMADVRTESQEVLFTSRFQSTGISRTIRCRYFPR